MKSIKKLTKNVTQLMIDRDNHDWRISDIKESIDYLSNNNRHRFIFSFPTRNEVLTSCIVILTITAVYYFIFK